MQPSVSANLGERENGGEGGVDGEESGGDKRE